MKEYLTTYDLARYGIPQSTAAKMRARGDGPPFIKIGRRIRYRLKDVETWVNEHVAQSNAQAHQKELARCRKRALEALAEEPASPTANDESEG